MSYAVVLAPEALDDLANLPLPVQNLIENELRRLGADPVSLSRPAHFPYVQAQCYKLETTHDDVRHFITILFRYSQDELSIEVFAIAVMKL